MSVRQKRSSNMSSMPAVLQQMVGLQSVVKTKWDNTSGTEQAKFYALTRRLHATPDGSLPPGKNAFNTYAQMAYACFYAGKPMPEVCPPLSLCLPLPDITTAARWVPDTGLDSGLSLSLTAEETYPHALAVWAAKPLLGGHTPAPTTRFSYVGYVPAGALGPTPFDASALYAVRYFVRSAGFLVGLRVVGVNEDGFCSPPQFLWASVKKTDTPQPECSAP